MFIALVTYPFLLLLLCCCSCLVSLEFSCRLSDNKYKVEFLEFEIKDYETAKSVFKVRSPSANVLGNDGRCPLPPRPLPSPPEPRPRVLTTARDSAPSPPKTNHPSACFFCSTTPQISRDDSPDISQLSLQASREGTNVEDLARTIRYKLPKDFLHFKTVRTL